MSGAYLGGLDSLQQIGREAIPCRWGNSIAQTLAPALQKFCTRSVMAKHRKRRGRKMGRYIKGNIDINLSGGTLTGATALLAATQVLTEKALISSIRVLYSLADFTPQANSGPIQVGVAHSDYSLVEVEEWIELIASWSEGDKRAREISGRYIRSIGHFEGPDGSADVSVLNDGKPITTKLNWLLATGQGLNFWIYNEGSVAFATTDPNIHFVGHANLWPR